MEQLISLLANYDLRLGSKGASHAEIDALERKCGRPFPLAYREFLNMCGTDPGELRIGGDAWTTIEALMGHYCDPLEMADTPDGAIVISTYGLCDPQMIVCDGSPEGGAVRTFACENPQNVSQSFRHLLFQSGWARATVCRKGTIALTAIWPKQDVATIASQLENMELQTLWFSDAFGIYSERSEAWAVTSTCEGEVYVSLRASVPATEREILNTLIVRLGPPRTHFYATNSRR
jgi:hypothetical protein